MSYLKVKSGYLDASGLKLEESDVDREEICSDRLHQLLTMHDILDSLPLNQKPVVSPTKSSAPPSIPSSKATRFGMFSRSWNFPKMEYPRQMCRSADFYKTSFRKPTRCASAPDLPEISKSEEVVLPLILKFSKKRSTKLQDDEFFIQGRNVLPSAEPEEQGLRKHTPKTSRSNHVRVSTTTVNTHAPSKCVHTPNYTTLVMSKDDKRNDFEMEFPLTARQCFPTAETRRNGDKNSTSGRNTKNKIQPMERKPNSKLNKYVQCRFGRRLGTSHKDPLKVSAHAHLLGIKDWGKQGGRAQSGTGMETVAMENVVENILGCREKAHGNGHMIGKQRLVEFLSCSGIELKPV